MNPKSFLSVVLLLLAPSVSNAADWPMYRGDPWRSGVAQETLAPLLSEHWTYQPARPQQQAWPEPGKERHRVDFDVAPQPVVADGIVYFGSATDDTLRALDAETGRVLWKYTTGGPIRLAPAVDSGKLYVTSDDGQLVCLDAKTGKLVWRFQAAQKTTQLLGNERLISRWPLRSGVLVDGGTAYLTAGMWPSEGVLIYALDAATGNIQWCNDTADTLYLAQPHASAFSLTGVAPQGYLLASKDLLIIPNGRGVPAAFERKDGKLRYFKPSDSKTHGESWATLSKNRLFNGGLVYELETGKQIDCPDPKVPLWAAQSFDYGTRKKILGYRGARIIVDGETIYGRRKGDCLALAGEVLLEGSDGKLQAFNTKSKRAEEVLWQADLEGQVRGIAVSDGRVFVSTDRGTIHCFGPSKSSQVRVIRDSQPAEVADHPRIKTITTLASQSKITKGYALVVGDYDGQLARSIAAKLKLHVLSLTTADRVDQLRAKLLDAGVYGSQVAVQSIGRLQNGDLPPYFANLVVVADGAESLRGTELWRVLRPCGGLLCFVESEAEAVARLVAAGEEPAAHSGTEKSIAWFRRGKLKGAFDWDSKNPTDERIKWPLELLWFGGPGPARMHDRHHSSVSPPAVANGRYYVPGDRHVIGVDAYNGTELWEWQFSDEDPKKYKKDIRLTGLTADEDHVYFSVGEGWLQLDGQTGRKIADLKELPKGLENWGRLPRRVDPYAKPLRSHALTKETVPRIYYRAYGCNQVLISEGVDFFRSGTLGFYDMDDDSGLRNFGAFRPGCWRSHNAALGIFISSEGASGCVCSYNFQTSLALAPARQRRNEDWAIYYDLPTDGLVRRAMVNLGAPGDRRDANKQLWLGYPRPQQSIVFQLPVSLGEAQGPGLGRYHFDTDRRKITNTKESWIYTSGYRGLREVVIGLDKQEPVVSTATKASPVIDGKMAEQEWPADPQLSLHPLHNRQNRGAPNRKPVNPDDWKSHVHFSHDAENLYVVFHQPNRIDRKGNPYAWRKTQLGKNARVWYDDSVELFLSDQRRETVIHLGLSASGGSFSSKCNLTVPEQREDAKWTGVWQNSVIADERAFIAEMSIPWKTLEEVGIDKDRLMVNAQSNWSGWRSPMRFLGSLGSTRCENFAPLGLAATPKSPQRKFRVRLHFAEPDDVQRGDRRFDIKLQGQVVFPDFDVLDAAGKHNTAVVREFDDVTASDTIRVELVPKGDKLDAKSETILSGVEIEEIEK